MIVFSPIDCLPGITIGGGSALWRERLSLYTDCIGSTIVAGAHLSLHVLYWEHDSCPRTGNSVRKGETTSSHLFDCWCNLPLALNLDGGTEPAFLPQSQSVHNCMHATIVAFHVWAARAWTNPTLGSGWGVDDSENVDLADF